MKILSFPFNYLANNKTSNEALYNLCTPVVHTIPDTALLLHDRPFFLPDTGDACQCNVQLAVRICRLGRSISERFAHRYYDAVTVAIHFTLHPLLEKLQAEGLPWDAACGFDNALALGNFITLNDAEKGAIQQLSLSINGKTAIQADTAAMRHSIDQLIAAASRIYTFRQGDILLTGSPAAPVEVNIDDHIDAALGHQELLHFNIK